MCVCSPPASAPTQTEMQGKTPLTSPWELLPSWRSTFVKHRKISPLRTVLLKIEFFLAVEGIQNLLETTDT